MKNLGKVITSLILCILVNMGMFATGAAAHSQYSAIQNYGQPGGDNDDGGLRLSGATINPITLTPGVPVQVVALNNVLPGNYIVNASGSVSFPASGSVTCSISPSTSGASDTLSSTIFGGTTTLALTDSVNLSAPGSIVLQCMTTSIGITVLSGASITAIQLG